MMDLSRVEESKLDLKKEFFLLNQLVTETVEDIKYTNNSHSIILTNNFNGNIYGDKDRLQQVIINLINNAIKYSPAKTNIEISINKAGDKIAVSVKDSGIGIAKKDVEKIFERFYRVTGKNEHAFSGFGIGLFLADEIIKRHNGEIKVESELNKGSIFTFTLPLKF